MKAGLEVHQQLATCKLFCDCPSELSETPGPRVRRRLRATSGEERQVDRAAAFQAARGLVYEYEVAPASCLVDLDDEPPHQLNEEALDVALTLALLLHARVPDEIQVMRKIVVDGSNTSGFQRTALVATDGWLEVGKKRFSIPTVCLEEDAARRVGQEHGLVRYRLDRLGIPLVEIATGPEISSGEEAREVAEELGALVRATGKVRRGIGSIREDLNVSVEGGARVEIKGVQELRLIERYAQGEVDRQALLLRLSVELRSRAARVPDDPPADVTAELRESGPGPVADIVGRGGVVLAVALPGFAGLLGQQEGTGERLGRELAEHARAAGLRGLLHSDELPNDAVGPVLLSALRQRLGLAQDGAFVLLAAPALGLAEKAALYVRDRARQALAGVPTETRDPLPDGRTRYSRPLPGRDRMYPETDVPPIPVMPERLEALQGRLPELPSATRRRLAEAYHLSSETTSWLTRNGEVARFESLVGRGYDPGLVARLLSQDLPNALAAPPAPKLDDLSDQLLLDLLSALDRGDFAKEALPSVIRAMLDGAPTAGEAARCAGISGMSRPELEEVTQRAVDRNQTLIDRRGADAFQPLMGEVMREVRGRRDGQEVADVVRAALERRLSGRPAGV